MHVCPRCGGKLRYELRSTGTKSKTQYDVFWNRKTVSKRKHVTVGYCPKCGYKGNGVTKGAYGFAGTAILLTVVITVIALAVSLIKIWLL